MHVLGWTLTNDDAGLPVRNAQTSAGNAHARNRFTPVERKKERVQKRVVFRKVRNARKLTCRARGGALHLPSLSISIGFSCLFVATLC